MLEGTGLTVGNLIESREYWKKRSQKQDTKIFNLQQRIEELEEQLRIEKIIKQTKDKLNV